MFTELYEVVLQGVDDVKEVDDVVTGFDMFCCEHITYGVILNKEVIFKQTISKTTWSIF